MNIKSDESSRLVASLKRAIEIIEHYEEKTCLTCMNWNGEGCSLANGATPPKKVIDKGCGSYENDGIPF